MKKITELTQTKWRTIKDKDAEGNVIRSKEEYDARRPVKTVYGWTRFGHYLIDAIILGGVYFGIMFALDTDLTYEVGLRRNSIFRIDLTSYALTLVYYFAFEVATGQTLGKMITQTVVIDEYGKKPQADRLLGRTLCRLIPFEAFSCIGEHSHGWHDKISKTWTVSKEELKTLQKLQREQSDVYVADDNLETLD